MQKNQELFDTNKIFYESQRYLSQKERKNKETHQKLDRTIKTEIMDNAVSGPEFLNAVRSTIELMKNDLPDLSYTMFISNLINKYYGSYKIKNDKYYDILKRLIYLYEHDGELKKDQNSECIFIQNGQKIFLDLSNFKEQLKLYEKKNTKEYKKYLDEQNYLNGKGQGELFN